MGNLIINVYVIVEMKSIVSYLNLTGKIHTKSCGCIRSESCKLREQNKNYPESGFILTYYKRNAKTRNIPWLLSREEFDVIVKQNCFYCDATPYARTANRVLVKFQCILME